jgi:hypothetical protein
MSYSTACALINTLWQALPPQLVLTPDKYHAQTTRQPLWLA